VAVSAWTSIEIYAAQPLPKWPRAHYFLQDQSNLTEMYQGMLQQRKAVLQCGLRISKLQTSEGHQITVITCLEHTNRYTGSMYV
jgi:hypothetical protein